MYRTPIKQKSAPCRACLVCGKGAQEVRRIESTKRSEINAKALLAKYGGINVESGVMCRNCYSKLQNLDQRCRLFYEECQRNSRTNTKRMSSSPLSGPQKRINFSKTQRKAQLFKESAAPESTTPEEIGLKVDFVTGSVKQKNDTAVRMTHEDYADDSSETASISENEQPYSLQYNTLVAGEEDRGLEYIDCGSIVEIPANESYTAVKDDSVNISEHAYAIPKSNERSDHDYCSSEISSVAHDVSKETRPEESESVHRLKKSKLKKPGVIANDFKAAVLDHGYAYVKSVKKARSGEKQQRKPSEATDNQPADHDYIKSRSAPLRYNPLLEKISSYMKDLEQNTNATSGLSERIKTSLCMVLLTSENMMEVASKFLEIEDLDKCLRYQRMLKIEKSSRSLGNRKYGYISQLMKKSPEDLRHFNWIEIVDEFMEKFPTFFGMILSMVLVQDKMHCYTAIEKVLPRIGLVYGILMQSRNMELSRIQRMISLLLFDNIADQKVFDRLQPMGVSLSYCRSLGVVELIGGHFNDQLIDLLKQGKRFRLVGDNINWKVGVHDQRLDNTSKMMHAFGSAAIVQNIDFRHLSACSPQRPYDETPVQAFLPSVDDIEAIKHDYTILASRVAFEFIPYFKSFEDIVPNDISKPCDPKLKEKSTVIPLPVLFKNEQYTQDVVKIMEFYEDCLNDAHQKAGIDFDNKHIHIGGDQLTRIRFSEAKAIRAHHPIQRDKFQHLSPITFELFHLYMNLLQMIFKTLYSSNSVQDIGTLKSLQDRISRTNVNQNINEHYDADKDFVISVTDMYLVECFLEFFGMEDVNARPTKHIPPEFSTIDEKREWYFKVVSSMIGDQIFPDASMCQSEELMEVDGHTFNISLINGQVISLMKPYTQQTEEKDCVLNYARRILEAGLLFKDLLDMTHLPERQRGLRLLKLCMVYLKSHKNLSKYAYEILRLLVHQLCILSERHANEEFYGLFVNTAGLYDSHIPTDRRMEYLVKQVKMHLKHMMSNKTEENISNRTRAISGIREISENFDRQCSVIIRSKRRSDKGSQGDELVLLNDLRRLRPFNKVPGRQHLAFPNITASVVDALNIPHFHNWVDTRKFYFAVEKGN